MMVAGELTFACRSTSMPSIAGNTTSSKAKSGFSPAKICRASSPLEARKTSKPSSPSARPRVRKVSASSSTISTEYGMLSDDLVILGCGFARLMHWQGHANRGARSGSALELNVASVASDVALADAKSEARAFPALGGEERLEDMRQNV